MNERLCAVNEGEKNAIGITEGKFRSVVAAATATDRHTPVGPPRPENSSYYQITSSRREGGDIELLTLLCGADAVAV